MHFFLSSSVPVWATENGVNSKFLYIAYSTVTIQEENSRADKGIKH